jgi:hypothetical protein
MRLPTLWRSGKFNCITAVLNCNDTHGLTVGLSLNVTDADNHAGESELFAHFTCFSFQIAVTFYDGLLIVSKNLVRVVREDNTQEFLLGCLLFSKRARILAQRIPSSYV